MKTDCDFLLAVLSDGQKHSRNHILHMSLQERGCGITCHSRASELRKKGYGIEVTGVPHRPRDTYYQLVSFPREQVPSPPSPDSPPVVPGACSYESDTKYPTRRAEAMREVTTAEVGFSACARSRQREGDHGQGCGTEAAAVTNRVEARHESRTAGGNPGSAPTAAVSSAQLTLETVA